MRQYEDDISWLCNLTVHIDSSVIGLEQRSHYTNTPAQMYYKNSKTHYEYFAILPSEQRLLYQESPAYLSVS